MTKRLSVSLAPVDTCTLVKASSSAALSPRNQLIFGAGLPLARHVNSMVSPSLTSTVFGIVVNLGACRTKSEVHIMILIVI